MVVMQTTSPARWRDGGPGGILICLALAFCLGGGVCQAHILRLSDGSTVTFPEMIDDLRQTRVVLIGEEHDNRDHHRAQLQIIEGLAATGARVAIGLEMFRAESQPQLDRWVAGELSLPRFMKAYRDNWGGGDEYNEIFLQARTQRWPLLGLNLSRRIVNQVAKDGFASLSEEQLAGLPVTRCVVDESYMRFIRRALGKHFRQEGLFVNFCEAQLLWDKVMAGNIKTYLDGHPQSTVVVLAGSGHAWKPAIPNQLQKLGEGSWRVVLPQVPGRTEPLSVTGSDGDYLLLGVEEGALH